MKKILLPLLFLFYGFTVFSQSKTDAGLSKEDYLVKSKKQKNAGIILLTGGAACLITSLVIPKGEVTSRDLYFGTVTYKNDGIKTAFGLAGSLLGTMGAVLFIISNKNKHKAIAKTVSLGNQTIIFSKENAFFPTTQPTLTIKIGL